ILYRDDEAVTEPVEKAPVAPADQARRDDLLVGVALLPKVADQAVPAVRGVAQAELFDRFGEDPAVAEVPSHLLAPLGAPTGLAACEVSVDVPRKNKLHARLVTV